MARALRVRGRPLAPRGSGSRRVRRPGRAAARRRPAPPAALAQCGRPGPPARGATPSSPSSAARSPSSDRRVWASAWSSCSQLAHQRALLSQAPAHVVLRVRRGRPARRGSARARPPAASRSLAGAPPAPTAPAGRAAPSGLRSSQRPMPARAGVGQPLGGQGEVAVEPAELDPHGRRAGARSRSRALRPRPGAGRAASSRRCSDPCRRWRARRAAARPARRSAPPCPRPRSLSRSSSRRASVSCTANFSSVSFAWRSALPLCRARLRIWDCTSAIRSSTRCRSTRRLLEAALGAVLPVAIEADARRLLEQRPALVGAVGEEQVDHLRLDDDAGVAAEAGAAQQVLDVPEPDRRAVEQVVALARAREPPGDHAPRGRRSAGRRRCCRGRGRPR